MALKVVRNEIDGWDVVREDEDVALSNHPDRQTAELAAHMRAEEEHIGESGGEPVVVATGGENVPRTPALARSLPRSIEQIHAATYRRSGLLPSGGVLVVETVEIVVAHDFSSEPRPPTPMMVDAAGGRPEIPTEGYAS